MINRSQLPDLPRAQWTEQVPLESNEEPSAHSSLSVAQIRSIMAAHWKLSVIIVVSLTLISVIVIKSMPKTYTAVATLIVNAGNRDPLSARQTPDDMLAMYVATQTELMLSPVILMPVVDRLKLTEDDEFSRGFNGTDPNALRDYVQKNLAAALEITQGRGGQLLFVAASARDSVKSADIANAVSDVYLEEEQRRISGPAGERAQRYSTELAELRSKAIAAQDKLIAFQQEHGITELLANNNSTETQSLANLQEQLLTAQSTRRQLESKLVGQEANTNEVMDSELIQELKTQLAKQQAQLAQQRTVLGPNHPSVLQLQSQIADTRQSLASEVSAFSATTATQLNRAKELEQKLLQAVADQRAKVLELRRLQDEGGKLIVERDSAQAVYKRALDGYDQILFAAVGDNANVSFISRATPPVKAAKPAKSKLAMGAAFLALLLGVGGPVIYDLLFDRRLRCRDDIERGFGVPVLAELDCLPAEAIGAA